MTRKPSKNAGRSPGSVKPRCNMAFIPMSMRWMMLSIDAYAAWPTRLYLVGLDGKVVYAGGLGPYDFKPEKLKAAIEKYLKSI